MVGRSRLLALSAAASLALTTMLFAPPPAAAHPEACDKLSEEYDAEHCVGDHAVTFDDSGARLAPGETVASKNLKIKDNIPQDGPQTGGIGSDIAFFDHYAVQGNYNGFVIYDIAAKNNPTIVANVDCPAAQNDVSVWRNYLVLSVDGPRTGPECDAGPASSIGEDVGRFEGLRLFDIRDVANPQYVGAVMTDCGSHTHTTVDDGDRAVIYVSSYGPRADFPNCQPPHDKISVVELSADGTMEVIGEPVLFPDGGFPGEARDTHVTPIEWGTSATAGCHDITVYRAHDLAAGACMGEGLLMDISDIENPVVIDSVTDDNFAFWHSATFNNDATSVVFTDELFGGVGASCNPTIGDEQGANGIYEITGTGADRKLEFASYYKIPRVQHNTENCVAHNGNLIPAKGRDLMVQAWYQGGISVMDFTDPANPFEVAHFDRGPISLEKPVLGGFWSAYWYNGRIWGSDITKGWDSFLLSDRAVAAAARNKVDLMNPQTQVPFRG